MKDIQGYENEYAITEDGKVWSYKSNIFLKPKIDKDGYQIVSLYKRGKRTFVSIHRLVALAYIPNPENKPTVDHINGDITNNNVNNLRWATCHEQLMNIHWRKKLRKPIVCIETGIIYSGITEIKNKLGLTHISDCVNGKRKTCGGYHWRRATQEEIEQNRELLNEMIENDF